MGVPVHTGLENFEEALRKLSTADRTKLAHWILETVVEEVALPEVPDESMLVEDPDPGWPPKNMKVVENPSGKKPWYGDFDPFRERTAEERSKAADEAWGAWAEWAPDDLAEQILAARTVSDRELPRYE